MKKIHIRKGQPYVLLIYVLGIIMIGFAFLILAKPAGDIYEMNHLHEDVMEQDYQLFYQRSRTLFLWLPFLLVLPTILWFLIKSQEKQSGLQ